VTFAVDKVGCCLTAECSLVGQKQGRSAHPEQAVGDEHGALIAKVPVLSDVLSAHHKCPTARVHLQMTKLIQLMPCSCGLNRTCGLELLYSLCAHQAVQQQHTPSQVIH